MKLYEIISVLENFAPPAYQESYDNSGLLVGDRNAEINSALLCIDSTEDVIDEAIENNISLVIAHHPIVFGGLKRFTGNNYVERTIIKAIKHNIAIYAAHTNLDSVQNGVNFKIAEKIGLQNVKVLSPIEKNLRKLVTFVPKLHLEKVQNAVFEAGAGKIGNYDQCSFNLNGTGTFRGLTGANPFVGQVGTLHFEEEVRLETIFPKHLQNKILTALLNAHPYEEVAYDIYSIENDNDSVGIGVVGNLPQAMEELEFLQNLKNIFEVKLLKHTPLLNKPIQKVALCGGSGSSLLKNAIRCGADIFISADFKYHQFFDAENKLIIADIGHYESEQFTKEIFYEILTKKFPNFAVQFSKKNTNPVCVL